MSPEALAAALAELEARIPADPRDPVVSDTARRRLGLRPDPNWGAHCGLPLFVSAMACLDLEATRAALDTPDPITPLLPLLGPHVFELGGRFVEPFGGRVFDAGYRGAHLRAGDALEGGPASVLLANAVFEEGSGIARTLAETDEAKAVRGLDYGAWRAEVAGAAAVEVLVALRPLMVPGSVLLMSNVLSPAVVAGDVAPSLGLAAVPPAFVEVTPTRFGRLQTAVHALVCVSEAVDTVVGPVFRDLRRGRMRRRYDLRAGQVWDEEHDSELEQPAHYPESVDST